MPGNVKSELLPDADRSHECDCQEIDSWKRNLPLDKSHFITEIGVNLIYIRDLLGHTSVTTTEIYYGQKKLMTSCTDGSAYVQKYPPEQLSIINASGH